MLWFYLGALITCIAFMVLSIIFITRAIRHNKKVLLDICAQKQGECQTYHGFIHWLSQKNALFLATSAFAVSAFIYLLPVVCTTPELSNGCEGITIFFVVVHNVLKLFVVDSDFSLVVNALSGQRFDLWFRIIYSFFGWIFFIGAPVFTAVSLISFVKDAFAMRSIKHHKPTNVYIFTELNFMSLSVVKSIVKKYIEDNGKRPLIVFANVYKSETEESRELIVKAEELGARCVSKDLVEIELDWFEKDDEVKLYCLGVNQDENMNQALKLVDRYHELFAKSNYDGYVKKPEIYVYTSTAESEALLDKIDKEHLHVRRINENRNLVFATLKEHSIFDDVDKENEGKEIKGDKQMNVAIIGLGGYGMELLKTLSWLGQAKGYYLNAFVFDGEDGREKLRAVAPDMLRYNYLGVLDKDEDAELIRELYERHISNPEEFATPYPYPSMAICDPSCREHAENNCWGYFSQGLIALRCTLWMDEYGFSEELDRLCKAWVEAWTKHYDTVKFGQELDPITGVPTDCSEWYSSTMLFYLYAVKRLELHTY